MHKSRFGSLIIDCKTDDLQEAAAFWSQALGFRTLPAKDDPGGKYVSLATGPDDPAIEVQQVDHESRLHLDIEADDIEAEVRRLEKLGAKRIADIHSWVVMEAPTGQRFCVIEPQKARFEESANEWP